MKIPVNTNRAFERIPSALPQQWLYLLGAEGVVYSETRNRFAGLDIAGVSAYRAFDAGASLEDLRSHINADGLVPPVPIETMDALDVIHALSRGVFPDEDAPAYWPAFNLSASANPRIANIEIHGIPIALDWPEGSLEQLCRDYFKNCAPTTLPARCHLSVQSMQDSWAIFVNGHKFFSLQREEQVGLGLMHAVRSLLYAEGEYDIAFHAAMVARGDCGAMLCAPREYGKSTLAAYLVAQDFDLLTDEPALLNLETSSVASLPLPVSLKEGSWPWVLPKWPQLTQAPIHTRSDGAKIRLAHAEHRSVQSRRLTHILFPQYIPATTAQAESLTPLRTLSLLNEGGMLLAKHLTQQKFEAFLNSICQTPAYAVRYSSLEDARRILHKLNV